MSNVIQFRPKPKEPDYVVDDGEFFISCLHTAANKAAYVHHDAKAVELLIDEMKAMYLAGTARTYLNDEIKQVCARYLSKNEHAKEDLTRSINFIYSVDETSASTTDEDQEGDAL